MEDFLFGFAMLTLTMLTWDALARRERTMAVPARGAVTPAVLAVAALVLMEPLTAVLHRVVFHGFGMGWHRSHHAPPRAARSRPTTCTR